MISDGLLRAGSMGLNCIEREVDDGSESSVLSIGGSYGELLKIKIENGDVFVDYLTGQPLDPT